MKVIFALAASITFASPASAGDNGCPNPQQPNRVEEFCCPAGYDALEHFSDGTTACDHMLVPPNDKGECYASEHRVESFFPDGSKACRLMNAGEAANYEAAYAQKIKKMRRILEEACADGDAEACRGHRDRRTVAATPDAGLRLPVAVATRDAGVSPAAG